MINDICRLLMFLYQKPFKQSYIGLNNWMVTTSIIVKGIYIYNQ